VIWGAIGIAWFAWWLTGAILPALVVPAVFAWMTWGGYMDSGSLPDERTALVIAIILTIAGAPYAYHKHRARKSERLLHGVRFNGHGG